MKINPRLKVLLIIFITVLPFGGFYLGARYQQKLCQQNISPGLEANAREVKYYFDNIETYHPGLAGNFSQQVTVRGLLVEKEIQPACMTAPCNPIKDHYLQDLNSPDYSVLIGSGNQLVSGLTLNKIYILNGLLWKGVDTGKKKVEIMSFEPLQIVN